MSWDPWAALAARPHLELRFDDVAALLGGGFYARRGPRALVALDPSLDGDERTAALAHELVHDERDGLAEVDGLLEVLVEREERAVEAVVADRLVPADELARLVAVAVEAGEGLGPGEVALAFGVPPAVAARALERLAGSTW